MIRKRAVLDTVNPPGQVRYIPGPDTIKHNVEEWKKLEQQKNGRSQTPTVEGLLDLVSQYTQAYHAWHGSDDPEPGLCEELQALRAVIRAYATSLAQAAPVAGLG